MTNESTFLRNDTDTVSFLNALMYDNNRDSLFAAVNKTKYRIPFNGRKDYLQSLMRIFRLDKKAWLSIANNFKFDSDKKNYTTNKDITDQLNLFLKQNNKLTRTSIIDIMKNIAAVIGGGQTSQSSTAKTGSNSALLIGGAIAVVGVFGFVSYELFNKKTA